MNLWSGLLPMATVLFGSAVALQAQPIASHMPLDHRWAFVMMAPDTGLGCTIVSQPAEGGPAVVSIGAARESGEQLVVIVAGTRRGISGHVPLPFRWTNGAISLEGVAQRYAVDGARFVLSPATDPEFRSAALLRSGPSRLAILNSSGQTELDVVLSALDPIIYGVFAMCMRQPDRFPAGVSVGPGDPVTR